MQNPNKHRATFQILTRYSGQILGGPGRSVRCSPDFANEHLGHLVKRLYIFTRYSLSLQILTPVLRTQNNSSCWSVDDGSAAGGRLNSHSVTFPFSRSG